MNTQQYQQVVFNAAKIAGLNDVQAKIITAQATHESGNFKSNVFKTDNNLFGMKMPAKRNKSYIERPSKITMTSEGSTPYAHYSSIQNSVNDLILSWHKYNRTDWSKIQTPEQYAAYLKSKGYYGDSELNYKNSLRKIFDRFTWLKYTPLIPVILLVVAAVFLIINQK